MSVGERTKVTGLIDDLFNIAMKNQGLYLKSCPFQDISLSEMHILEAISLEAQPTMSNVSNRLMVTMGTLTTGVGKLIEKGYCNKKRSETDKRIWLLSLTPKGHEALVYHDKFHDDLEEIILEPFENDDYLWVVNRLEMILETLKKENQRLTEEKH